MTYQIETTVPLPSSKSGEIIEALRLLKKAAPGASVYFPNRKPSSLGPLLQEAGLRGLYAARAIEGGVRVWRKAEKVAA